MPRSPGGRGSTPRPTSPPFPPLADGSIPHLGSQNRRIRSWFTHRGRELPWRRPPAPGPHPGGWRVLVSEAMLQQTPVDRVIPAWTSWVERWPRPSALAGAPVAEAIRAWGRLGYPRRALRLHAAARLIAEEHGDLVPADAENLRALPGVGDYTAGAVLCFAYGQQALALDTNVRRVIARHDGGQAAAGPSITRSEIAHAERIQPTSSGAAWMAAIMELGALVCTAREPACERCPVSQSCRWLALGRPEGAQARRQPRYAGSDRQARGALLAVLRASGTPVSQHQLDLAWPDEAQRARALDGLVADGLVAPAARRRWALPD